MKHTVMKWWAARERKRRIAKDARILGSQVWAERFAGWFDDVGRFRAEPDGGIHLKELGVSVPAEIGQWLLGRNRNYLYCIELSKCGASFSVEAAGLVASIGGGRYLLEPDTLFILWELVVEKAYYWVRPPTPPLIFDIGMNVGFASLVFADRFPEAEVVGFEPFGNTFARLQRNLAMNPQLAKRIHPHPWALANRNAEETWGMSADNAGTSSQFSGEVAGRQVPMPVVLRSASAAMDSALSRFPGRTCIVKMDCEGGEYAIMDDWAASGFLDRIHFLAMEYHEMGGHSLDELEEWFRQHGFCAVVQPKRMDGRKLPFGAIFAFPEKRSGNVPG